MKKLFFFLLIILITGCNKPKTVLICGDHVCINKTEAEQYFEDNLTLEVKIIERNKSKKMNIIELNLKQHVNGEKKILISKKKEAYKEIKILSNNEIEIKKAQLKKRKEDKIKINKKNNKLIKNEKKINKPIKNKKIIKKISKTKLNNIKKSESIVDICTIIEKCNIDEISKYLIKKGQKKNYPDITTRE
jgi:hypothetical protein